MSGFEELVVPVGLALGGAAILSGLLIWLGRAVRMPDPSVVVVRIEYRRWPGRFLRFAPPAGFLLLAVVFTGSLIQSGWSAGGGVGGLVGLAVGAVVGIPLVTIAWGWNRVFAEEPAATREALFIHGNRIPWERIEPIQKEELGLLIRVPSARIFRREHLLGRTYRIDDRLIAELEQLRRQAIGAGDDEAGEQPH